MPSSPSQEGSSERDLYGSLLLFLVAFRPEGGAVRQKEVGAEDGAPV